MAWSDWQHQSPPADLPLAPLYRINYKKLVAGNAAEIERLFAACKDTGFFYLDLENEPILKNVDEQFEIGEEFYKVPGFPKVDSAGNKDWTEFINVKALDIIDGDDDRAMRGPDILNHRKPQLRAFVERGHGILTTTTQLRFTCSTPTWGPDITPISFVAHTDATALTLLFNQTSGLQILPAEAQTDDEWLWVRPLPGHVIVNVGDAMSILSNQQFKSNRHRVVRPWGQEAQLKRFSVLNTLRPDDDATMAGISTDGHCLPRPDGRKPATGLEWSISKFRAVHVGKGLVQDPTRVEVATDGKIFGY
ncbi:hypothetical protein FKW77_001377 [Venturia effusa]|uniref:Fe2OG dioxygenase domain-containing protein n=1 Tax=Venturia effusa TaxID=50376 RepID=A0A517LND1_9PEZI|nr:hypothetical protein FKW77_001377 [Venturia effusa]